MCVKILVILALMVSFANCSEHFPYQQAKYCAKTKFFSTSTFQCTPCGKFQVSSDDGLSCVCMPGFWRTYEAVGGTLSCVQCPRNHVTTEDGLDCIRCLHPLTYNPRTRRCSQCPVRSVTVELSPNGTRTGRGCLRCSPEALPSIDGAGGVCRRCDQSRLVAAYGNCTCPDSHHVIGGVCISATELNLIPAEPSMYMVEYSDGTIVDSAFFRKYTRASAFLCRFRRNTSACHMLANLCTMSMYGGRGAASACGQLRLLGATHRRAPPHVPWLLYDEDEAITVLGRTRITQEFTVQPNKPSSYLNLTVAAFSVEGTFLGWMRLADASSIVCPELFANPETTLRFGARYDRTCTVSGRDLLSLGAPRFYELYLYYRTEQGPRMYAVPVLVTNYRRNHQSVNQEESQQRWQLVHRFFLVDSVSAVAADRDGQTDGNKLPEVVQYVTQLHLHVQLQEDRPRPGRILPPLLTLTYGTLRRDQLMHARRHLSIRLRVDYAANMAKTRENIEVAVGVMSAFAAVWAIFRTWAWSSRNGKAEVDALTLVHLLVSACGSLANVFLMVMFGSCFYWFVFFKRQRVAFSLLPTQDQEDLVRGLVIAAFVLKTVDVVWLLVRQVNISLFFIDWERPRARASMPHPHLPPGPDGSDTVKLAALTHPPWLATAAEPSDPVSIWRTYFIANEWNELQALRKISQTWQLILVLFFLEIVGFIQLSAADPDARMDYGAWEARAPDAFVCRFCVIVLVYCTVALVQWAFVSLVYERFVEHKLQQFVDLCSLANISVFILYERNFGYYLHGRSVHGHADADLASLYEQLQREEEDLCSRRGLVPGSDQQTFQILLPNKFRDFYDQMTFPMQQRSGSRGYRSGSAGGAAGASGEPPSEQARQPHPTVKAYNTMNKFLALFIEHAIKSVDYAVKDKKFIEKMIDVEFADSDDKGVFYNDRGRSFQMALLYGHEGALIVFDLLLFCFVDILASNLLLAAIIVYCVGKLMRAARYFFGRRNLARKTLVDERFLI